MGNQSVLDQVNAELARLGQSHVQADAHEGVVTLVGEVADAQLRRIVGQEILRLPEVLELRNELRTPSPEGDLPSQLRQLMESEGIAIEALTIEATPRGLRLKGRSQGWFDRDAAERLAWELPGIGEVVNEIDIPADAPDPELAERRP